MRKPSVPRAAETSAEEETVAAAEKAAEKAEEGEEGEEAAMAAEAALPAAAGLAVQGRLRCPASSTRGCPWRNR